MKNVLLTHCPDQGFSSKTSQNPSFKQFIYSKAGVHMVHESTWHQTSHQTPQRKHLRDFHPAGWKSGQHIQGSSQRNPSISTQATCFRFQTWGFAVNCTSHGIHGTHGHSLSQLPYTFISAAFQWDNTGKQTNQKYSGARVNDSYHQVQVQVQVSNCEFQTVLIKQNVW